MYRIKFYRSRDGKKPVLEYLRGLTKKNDKDSRIKANKIRDYIKTLSHYGTAIGEPYIKKLDGDIWELRPLQDRILFAAWVGKSFLLISHFVILAISKIYISLHLPRGICRDRKSFAYGKF